MTKEHEFRPKEKEKKEQGLIAERLVLSYQAIVHFTEAKDWALKTPGADVSNALIRVADEMAEADIEPLMILDTLNAIYKHQMPDKNSNLAGYGISAVEALLGRDSRDYLRLGEAKVRKHEDPSPILIPVVDRLLKNRPHYDPEGRYAVDDLSRIGTLLFKAGHYPNPAFDKAEEIIPKVEINTDECKSLSREYAECGLFEDAIKIVNSIDNLRQKLYHSGSMMEDIIKKQADAGFIKEALDLASRRKSPLLKAEIMAKKAIKEAEEGIDPSQTIIDIQTIIDSITITDSIKDQESRAGVAGIYSLIFVAHVKSEKIKEARETLKTAESLINKTDTLYKSDAGFALANAVDDAGFDATEYYRKGFSYADEFAKENPEWCEMFGMEWEMYKDGVRFLASRGYFELAKEYIDKIPGYATWEIAILISELAKNEAREGLKPEEIENLSKEDIKSILEGKNEAAKEAIIYFGLNKRL